MNFFKSSTFCVSACTCKTSVWGETCFCVLTYTEIICIKLCGQDFQGRKIQGFAQYVELIYKKTKLLHSKRVQNSRILISVHIDLLKCLQKRFINALTGQNDNIFDPILFVTQQYRIIPFLNDSVLEVNFSSYREICLIWSKQKVQGRTHKRYLASLAVIFTHRFNL